jgi:hypothetical protein
MNFSDFLKFDLAKNKGRVSMSGEIENIEELMMNSINLMRLGASSVRIFLHVVGSRSNEFERDVQLPFNYGVVEGDAIGIEIKHTTHANIKIITLTTRQ